MFKTTAKVTSIRTTHKAHQRTLDIILTRHVDKRWSMAWIPHHTISRLYFHTMFLLIVARKWPSSWVYLTHTREPGLVAWLTWVWPFTHGVAFFSFRVWERVWSCWDPWTPDDISLCFHKQFQQGSVLNLECHFHCKVQQEGAGSHLETRLRELSQSWAFTVMVPASVRAFSTREVARPVSSPESDAMWPTNQTPFPSNRADLNCLDLWISMSYCWKLSIIQCEKAWL